MFHIRNNYSGCITCTSHYQINQHIYSSMLIPALYNRNEILSVKELAKRRYFYVQEHTTALAPINVQYGGAFFLRPPKVALLSSSDACCFSHAPTVAFVITSKFFLQFQYSKHVTTFPPLSAMFEHRIASHVKKPVHVLEAVCHTTDPIVDTYTPDFVIFFNRVVVLVMIRV